MLLHFGEDHKSHLAPLTGYSSAVLIDFCKLALDYLQNGPNLKRYELAGEKLDEDPSVIQNAVQALVYFLLECCKYNISEQDIKLSLSFINFNSEQQEVLVRFYSAKRNDVTKLLLKLDDDMPSYQDLQWRFEVQIASTTEPETIKPSIVVNLTLATSKQQLITTNPLTEEYSRLTISNDISDAKTTNECDNIISQVPIRCDIPNLLNLTSKLEEALEEAKSQHVRKIQRNLKKS